VIDVPEGLEVELYRRAAAVVVGRRIARIDVDERVVAGDAALVRGLAGTVVTDVGRRGKMLVLCSAGGALGVHFGMTGRIVVDGAAPIERLSYGAKRDDPAWDRLAVVFAGGGSLRVNDPRRLGRVVVDVDLEALGPDWSEVTKRELARAVGGRRVSIKAVLLDQSALAGLGNLCVDEVLWWSAIDPRRAACDLRPDEVASLHRAIHQRLPSMLRRGGSHTGAISPEVRRAVAACPRDATPLRRDEIAGRTTIWCPHHQR
jgi:formamidopyrimidine-DNA glycosylase